ncbi:DUF4184 family protein [Pontibacter sp. H249]|uniref:DUF4184 family protein n=1 Tax=Pontibacter sp. H249 TaxID=3133420 RepID=UPI0030C321F1
MPFTFSHPAVVLPLCLLPRKWVSVTGLIVGSLMPDFEKFLKMAPGNTISHTWEGIFWFNLPLGILLAFLFHDVVRNPLIYNLPKPLKKRFVRYVAFDWRSYFRKKYLVIVLSILFGAVSHIGWDSITHREGLGVQLLGFLSKRVTIWDSKFALYHLLDILGSVLGAIFILGFILFLPVKPKKANLKFANYWSLYWPSVLVIALFIVVLRGIFSLEAEAYWNMIITSISAFLIGVTVSSCFVKYNLK